MVYILTECMQNGGRVQSARWKDVCLVLVLILILIVYQGILICQDCTAFGKDQHENENVHRSQFQRILCANDHCFVWYPFVVMITYWIFLVWFVPVKNLASFMNSVPSVIVNWDAWNLLTGCSSRSWCINPHIPYYLTVVCCCSSSWLVAIAINSNSYSAVSTGSVEHTLAGSPNIK